MKRQIITVSEARQASKLCHEKKVMDDLEDKKIMDSRKVKFISEISENLPLISNVNNKILEESESGRTFHCIYYDCNKLEKCDRLDCRNLWLAEYLESLLREAGYTAYVGCSRENVIQISWVDL